MNKLGKYRFITVIFLVVFIFSGFYIFLSRYLKILDPAIAPGTTVVFREDPSNYDNVPFKSTEVVQGLYVPWDIEFTDNSRFLVTERNGSIKEVVNGNLNTTPLIVFGEVVEIGESGLMGMAKHPDYEKNKYLYVCLTYQAEGGLSDKIERLVDRGGEIGRDRVILDSVPAARFHAGCRIKFGPDKKLYVTTGDATTKEEAQNLNSLAGKILRMNDDGSVPDDNPFGSLVYSYGHRNPQGIDWHESGVMYATEHGPSGNDGPGGGDEINLIEKGKNYGWPLVSHQKSQEGLEIPKLLFTPAEAPAGMVFYKGEVFPQFRDTFFFTALRGSGIFRVLVDKKNPSEIIEYEKLDIDYGRIRDIEVSPDGLIYFATSNRDGRGRVREGDDKIFRFEPNNL